MPSRIFRNLPNEGARKTYVAWVNMRQRCTNPLRKDYKNYGMRGITYDQRWEDFDAFLRDMGMADKEMTLDRIDNSLDYSKANCRWATRAQQNNNKRNNVRYALNGESKTLTEWSKTNGIGRVTMLKRIQSGVPLEIALTEKGFCGYRRELKK